MKKELEQLRKELNERIDNLIKKEEPKDGEWYSVSSGGNGSLGCDGYLGLIVSKYNESNIRGACYGGKNPVLRTIDNEYWRLSDGYKLRKATESEILEAFTNYFRRKGFVSGKSRFKSAMDAGLYTYNEPLTYNGSCIFANGFGVLFNEFTLTLATLIEEEEKIMVGDKEVVFEYDYITIDGCGFSKDRLKLLLPANPELFGKILKRLNK